MLLEPRFQVFGQTLSGMRDPRQRLRLVAPSPANCDVHDGDLALTSTIGFT